MPRRRSRIMAWRGNSTALLPTIERDWQASDAKLLMGGRLDSYLDCDPYDIWVRDEIVRVCG
jgi:hypothetical protein